MDFFYVVVSCNVYVIFLLGKNWSVDKDGLFFVVIVILCFCNDLSVVGGLLYVLGLAAVGVGKLYIMDVRLILLGWDKLMY